MRRRVVAAVALWCAVCGVASAQIVNVLPLTADSQDRFNARLQGGIDLRRGNTDLLLFRASISGTYRQGRRLFLLVGKGEIGTKSGDRFASHVFGHGRYRQSLRGFISVEAFLQSESDEFRRLSLRALAGAGARVELPFDGGLFSTGLAYMAEQERLREGDEPDAGEETFSNRASSYVAFEWVVADRLTLNQTTFAQPKLDDFGDMRILTEATMTIEISKSVSAPTTLTVTYDSEPASGVESTDAQMRSAIAVRF